MDVKGICHKLPSILLQFLHLHPPKNLLQNLENFFQSSILRQMCNEICKTINIYLKVAGPLSFVLFCKKDIFCRSRGFRDKLKRCCQHDAVIPQGRPSVVHYAKLVNNNWKMPWQLRRLGPSWWPEVVKLKNGKVTFTEKGPSPKRRRFFCGKG